jgi:hypothetical protein
MKSKDGGMKDETCFILHPSSFILAVKAARSNHPAGAEVG